MAGTRLKRSSQSMSSIHSRTAFGMLLVAGILAVAGCTRNAGPPPAPPPPVVTVARPAAFLVQGYYEYNGHLQAVETVEIRARVKGLLQEIHFVEGAEVAAKQ